MSGLETLPERLARVEGRVEEHSKTVEDLAGRFTLMEGRFDRMEASVHSRSEAMEARFDRFEAGNNARFERVEARLDHFDAKFTGMISDLRQEFNGKFAAIDGKFAAMDGKFAAIDGKFAAIDGKFAAMDERFGAIDKKFDGVDGKFDGVNGRFSVLEERMIEHFRWTAGLVVTAGLTLAAEIAHFAH